MNTYPDGKLELIAEVNRTEVAAGDTLHVTLTAYNRSIKPLIIETSCLEFAGLLITHEGENTEFGGVEPRCVRIINTYEIEPRDSLSFSWDFEAVILSIDPETMDVLVNEPAPGNYKIHIINNIITVNDQSRSIGDLNKMFTVK